MKEKIHVLKEKGGEFFKDFKAFAIKGNVIDMAVGVIVGGAFGKIITSLVSDIVMPLFAMVLGNKAFESMFIVLREASDPKDNIVLYYGNFILQIVDFLIIAFSIFIVLRLLIKFKRKQETAPVEIPLEPTAEERLLTEIRDLLKESQNKE